MLTIEQIRRFIDDDRASPRKNQARVGLRYYEGQHDILNYRILYVDGNGDIQEDKWRWNIKISHPFFPEQVDQAVQYILSGKEGFLFSDDPALQKELDAYFNENEEFMAELYEVLTGAIVKGFEHMYAYKREDGRVAFQCADSLGIVEVKAKETDDGCEYVIHWYVDSVTRDGKKIIRIEVWDKEQTWFYVQDGEAGKIVPDDSKPINPRPHQLYTKGENGPTYYDGFGFIPFFRLDNNRKQLSSLKPIKPHIDDYDLISCGLSNNIQDTAEALYVVSGFSGDNLDELIHNIKSKKHIGVPEGGGVEIKTIDIPYEARQAKLELDERNIYRFGQALNTSGLKDTTATTNLAIKAAYSLLDLKANKLEIRLKQFLRKLLEVVLKEINDRDGTDYRQENVYFRFEREVPTNAQENAQVELLEAQRRQVEINVLLGLAANLDNETMMKLICEQLDIDYEEIRDKLPEPVTVDPYSTDTALGAVGTVQPESEGGGAV